MIFGNLGDESRIGYLYTRDPVTGDPTSTGEYQMTSQRCSSYLRQTNHMSLLQTTMPDSHLKLIALGRQIEERLKDMQIIGFTIESGDVWIVKSQCAIRTPQAAVRIVSDFVVEGLFSKEDAVFFFFFFFFFKCNEKKKSGFCFNILKTHKR
jgi:hypothetical protein